MQWNSHKNDSTDRISYSLAANSKIDDINDITNYDSIISVYKNMYDFMFCMIVCFVGFYVWRGCLWCVFLHSFWFFLIAPNKWCSSVIFRKLVILYMLNDVWMLYICLVVLCLLFCRITVVYRHWWKLCLISNHENNYKNGTKMTEIAVA